MLILLVSLILLVLLNSTRSNRKKHGLKRIIAARALPHFNSCVILIDVYNIVYIMLIVVDVCCFCWCIWIDFQNARERKYKVQFNNYNLLTFKFYNFFLILDFFNCEIFNTQCYFLPSFEFKIPEISQWQKADDA